MGKRTKAAAATPPTPESKPKRKARSYPGQQQFKDMASYLKSLEDTMGKLHVEIHNRGRK